MLKIRNKIIVFAILFLTSSALFSFVPDRNFSSLFKPRIRIYDTTGICKYVNRAYKNLGERLNTANAKANIDSAEAICDSRGFENPPFIDLVKAEYSLAIKNYSNAFREASSALDKARNLKDRASEAKALTFLARYHLITGNLTESLSFFESSTALAKRENINGVIPNNYIGISEIHKVLKKQDEYIEVLSKAAEAARSEYDTSRLIVIYFRLGSSLTENNRDFIKADSILKLCVRLSGIKENSLYSGLAWSNIGWNYYLENQYDSAIVAYNRSLAFCIPDKFYSTSASSYGNLGTIYRDLGDKDKALGFYDKAIEQATLADDNFVLSWVYQDMSDLFLHRRDTSNAYKYYVLFKKYSDLNLTRTNSLGMDEATARFEAETHNKEVELLSLKLRNQKLVIYGSSAFFLLLLSVVILVYSRARIMAKRKIIEMDRKISEITQVNLRQQMNPHFIFNTLNSIQYYMYQNDKLATNDYMTKFSSLIRKVLENSQHTAIPIRDELDAVKLYLELESVRFKGKFDYQINIDRDIDIIFYKIPSMLIQPYVENSICHGLTPSEYKGLVKIDIQLKDKQICCIIEDNGIGRKAAQERKNGEKKNHNSLGTRITGSRLELVNSFYGTNLKTLYTDLYDTEGNPSGTRVVINLPILT